MKHLFWAVPAMGLLIACAHKPIPPAAVAENKVNGQEVIQADGNRSAGTDTLFPFDPDPPSSWVIHFEYNSAELKETTIAAEIARAVKRTGGRAMIKGFTSPEGEDAYNLALGDRRAVAVRAYLVAFGIPASRIRWQSFGEEHLITEDPAQYNLNRRAEITLEDPQ